MIEGYIHDDSFMRLRAVSGRAVGGCPASGSATLDRGPIPSPAAPRWPSVESQIGVQLGHSCVVVVVVVVVAVHPGAGGLAGRPFPCRRKA